MFREDPDTNDNGGTYEKEQMVRKGADRTCSQRSAEHDGDSGFRCWNR